MTVQGRVQSFIDKARRPHVIRTFAIAVILFIVLLQFSVIYVRQQSVSSDISQDGMSELTVTEEAPLVPTAPAPTQEAPLVPTAPAPTETTPIAPKITYLFNNTDPGVSTRPADMVDFCNNLPQRRHPREMYISKSTNQPLKVFTWQQTTWAHKIDWAKESLMMCPFPVALQPFFDHFLETRVKDASIKWDIGYAPCIIWKLVDGDIVHKKQKCNTANYGKVDYIMTTNYTDFEQADIVYFTYPYWDNIDKPPYIDLANMPPRISHQKWVLWWYGESIANYPHVGLPQYQNLFDLSIGSPAVIMDITLPLYGFTNEAILKLANIPPSFPLDKKPDNYAAMLVHNCWAKNNRKDLMQALIDKAGAHSYGECLNNKEVPKGLGNDEGDQGIWMLKKLKILSGYPFVFAAENSNCVGYVTEKIYNALEVGAIPIYMGASDIADFVPEGSYVDVSKFKSFDEVVEYIKTVDRSQFYKWKEVVKKDPSKFCRSCFKPTVSAMCSIIDRVRFMDNTLP
ncbi:4-alpha-L-fucosyltransferase [Podila minutissima]|nr:4-alpha-L-fucosyltransferase [Podila minutissima]